MQLFTQYVLSGLAHSHCLSFLYFPEIAIMGGMGRHICCCCIASASSLNLPVVSLFLSCICALQTYLSTSNNCLCNLPGMDSCYVHCIPSAVHLATT